MHLVLLSGSPDLENLTLCWAPKQMEGCLVRIAAAAALVLKWRTLANLRASCRACLDISSR